MLNFFDITIPDTVHRRAFRFGRNAAQAYLDGLERGGTSSAVRHWIETLGPEHLAAPEAPDSPIFDVVASCSTCAVGFLTSM